MTLQNKTIQLFFSQIAILLFFYIAKGVNNHYFNDVCLLLVLPSLNYCIISNFSIHTADFFLPEIVLIQLVFSKYDTFAIGFTISYNSVVYPLFRLARAVGTY